MLYGELRVVSISRQLVRLTKKEDIRISAVLRQLKASHIAIKEKIFVAERRRNAQRKA